MDVKGWMIVGPPPWSWAGSLAPPSGVPRVEGVPPDPTNMPQGTTVEWVATPGGPPITLVVVSVQLAPGLI